MYPDDSIYRRRSTVAKCFTLEGQFDTRHEYYRDEIFPMDGVELEAIAGATCAHNTLKQNYMMAPRQSLRGSGCRVFE